jgi:hypothetical protein
MRRSTVVQLTLLPMLASAAVASAEPDAAPQGQGEDETEEAELAPPGMTPLSPPGMTEPVWELTCDNDPNWKLRNDCREEPSGAWVGDWVDVVRGGFGGYFSPPNTHSKSHARGHSGGHSHSHGRGGRSGGG